MTTKASEELITVPKGMEGMITLERPAGKDEGLLGNEGIGRGDVLIPRLGLAQKMSPEIDETQVARCITGLKFTDFFHSLDKRGLGKGPLYFSILRRDEPRWVEFKPIAEGGGIVDPNVPAGDARTQWHGDEKPVATAFLDYLVLLLTDFDASDPLKSIIALSLKSSGIKAAKHLNFLINTRGQKLICKGVYAVTSGSETDKKSGGVYATYKFKNAGWLTPGSTIEALAIEMHEAWKDRALVIDQDEADDDVPFDVPTGGAGGDTSM